MRWGGEDGGEGEYVCVRREESLQCMLVEKPRRELQVERQMYLSILRNTPLPRCSDRGKRSAKGRSGE